ncbi:serine protease [Lentzea sp. NPDC034063]|uniref:S1 family peptidase n=1 Tax=unclassified Lentzea TaxID=2643253 RepID=UPI0034002697
MEVLGGGGEYGSGYRISTHLILTAAHLLHEEISKHKVRLSGGTPTDAEVVWRGAPGVDIAVLRLVQHPSAETSPAVFGDLSSSTRSQIDFEASGYPKFTTRSSAEDDPGVRESKHVVGTIQAESNSKTGLLDLSITTAAPRDTTGDPWVGMSGAAVRTPQGLVVGVMSRRLPAAGTSSADAVDIGRALADPLFASIIRENGCSVVAVAERQSDSVVSHQRMVAGLSKFRRNLIAERLPFVDPGDHDSAPGRLFERLKVEGGRGLLLVGVAGSGKSRTCFEVAQVAEKHDWRVLHVKPGEPLATYDDVDTAVRESGLPTLVIVDYASEYRGFEPAALCDRLIPDARARGQHVAVLASARPGWLLVSKADPVKRAFDQVHLRTDPDHLAAVQDAILLVEAPTAIERYGRPWLSAICGKRPVITMLIAREIEARVLSGLLVQPDQDVTTRSGDLLRWLNQRLAEDEMDVPAPESMWDVVSPTPRLQAISALVASCPQSRPAVEAAAAVTLRELGQPDSHAPHLVDVLLRMGWLEDGGDELEVVHDIVVDQLLERVLLSSPENRVRTEAAEAVLAPCYASARTCGRYATQLNRLMRDLEIGAATALGDFCRTWMRRHAARVNEAMCADPLAGGYALGALLDGPPWGDTPEVLWPELITPWLEQYGDTVHARHLFYRGLRLYDAGHLVPSAVQWLNANIDRLEAEFVLGALLARRDSGEHRDEILDLAMTWFTTFCRVREAHFALRGLLGCADLGDRLTPVLKQGQQWLRRHRDKPEAGGVLAALVTRTDLGDNHATASINWSVAWLGTYPDNANTHHVLAALATRSDLLAVTDVVLRHAMSWLEVHRTAAEASRLLFTLMARSDLGERRERLVEHGMAWLRVNNQHGGAGQVLHGLLALQDSADVDATVSEALTWISSGPGTSSAMALAKAMLAAPHLGQHGDTVLAAAETVLRHNWADAEACHLLRILLSRPNLPARMAELSVGHALNWLSLHVDRSFACHVIGPVLVAQLGDDQTASALAYARQWLAQYENHLRADFVLKSMLMLPRLSRATLSAVSGHVLRWLESCADVADISYTVSRLVLRAGVDQATVSKLVKYALPWLKNNLEEDGAGHLLQGLLARMDLAADDLAEVLGHTETWLETNARKFHATYVLGRLFARRDLDPDLEARVLELALGWLRESGYGRTAEAEYLFRPLLTTAGLLRESAPVVFGHVFDWIDSHRGLTDVSFVLGRVIMHPEVDGETFAKAERVAFSWLDENPGHRGAGHVLQSVLSREDLDGASLSAVVKRAETWLEDNAGELTAANVLGRLVSRRDLDPDLEARVLELALGWLGEPERSLSAEAEYLIKPLLAVAGLSRESAFVMFGHVFDWLDSRTESADVSYVISRMLAHPEADEPTAAKLMRYSIDWLDHKIHEDSAGRLLQVLLARRDLDEPATAALLGFADLWLANNTTNPNAGFVLGRFVSRDDLGVAYSADAWIHAQCWLDRNQGAPSGVHVLRGLLRRPDLDFAAAPALWEYLLTWLKSNVTVPDAGYMHSHTLKHRGLDAEQSKVVSTLALQWLDHNPEHGSANYVLQRMLKLPDLDEASAGAVLGHAGTWLDRNQGHLGASHLLTVLLDAADRNSRAIVVARESAMSWLRLQSAHRGFAKVLSALLKSATLSAGPDVAEVADLAMDWFRWNADDPGVGSVLTALVARIDQEPYFCAADEVVHQAHQWCEHHLTDPGPARLLGSLVKADCPANPSAIMSTALRWREHNRAHPRAWLVIVPLLQSRHLNDGRQRAGVVEWGLGWVDDNPGAYQAGHLLWTLLSTDFSPEAARCAERWFLSHHREARAHKVIDALIKFVYPCVSDAEISTTVTEVTEWITDHLGDVRTGKLIGEMLALEPLRGPVADEVLDRAVEWLKLFGSHPEAGEVVDLLVSHPDLGERAPQAAVFALRWRQHNPEAPAIGD